MQDGRSFRARGHIAIEAMEARRLLSTVTLTPTDNIAAAVNAAQPGDIIRLSAGTYGQGIDINVSGTAFAPIRLEAQVPGTVIIDANGGGTGIGGSGQYIQISGLTIRNQSGWGTYQLDSAALRVGTGWTVSDVVVQNNNGAGVGVLGNNVTLLRVTSENNGKTGIGGWHCTNVLVKDCTVRNNNTRKFDPNQEGGGGKWYQTTGVTIDNLKSYGNYGPGVWFDWENSNYTVRNGEFYGNMGVNYGWEGNGIMTEANNGTGVISGNYVHDNTGWALALYEVSNLTVQNNIITNDSIAFRNLSGRDPFHVGNVSVFSNTFNSGLVWASLGSFPVINNDAGVTLNIASSGNTFNNPAGMALYNWNSVDYTTIASVRSNLSFELTAPATDTTPPTPSPSTWATAPHATSPTSISMTATTASDPSGVQYFFRCLTAGGHDSGWQASATYQDTGLTPNTTYTYQVMTQDQSPAQNQGSYSISASATTQPVADITAPTPNPSTWAIAPHATSPTSISMTATTASDPSGVQYFFHCLTPGGHDSGWQASATYQDTGLSPNTSYTYEVRTRDTSASLNLGAFSATAMATTQAAPIPGSGLRGEYFDNVNLTGLKVTRTDPAINFNWANGSPDPSVGVDTFSVRWTGQVRPAYGQTYTFYSKTDDGVRLWVNGQQLIDKWQDQGGTEWSGTISLAAGQLYDIAMEYFDNGWSAAASLSWSSASQANQIIPTAALYPPPPPAPDTEAPSVPGTPVLITKSHNNATIQWAASTDNVAVTQYQVFRNGSSVGTSTTTGYADNTVSPSTAYSYTIKAVDAAGNPSGASGPLAVTTDAAPVIGAGTGLRGEYFDNRDLTNLKVTRTDATVNFNWANGSPDPSVGVDTFSVRWSGQVQPLYTQTYTFYTATDDGVRLWVNGAQLINKWQDQGGTEWSGTAALAAGQKYDVIMEYYENGWGARASLSWSGPSQSKQIIPSTQLYTPPPPAPDILPPSVPQNLRQTGQSDTTVTLAWDAATDNLAVTGYEIWKGGAKLTNTAGTAFTDTSLVSGSSFSYQVLAYDAAGNSSELTSPVSAQTSSTPPPPPIGTGLTGEYFDNIDLTNLKLTRTDAAVNFNWGSGSPSPLVGVDTFSVRWTGKVRPTYSQTYTFYTKSDDGVRLWVNGVQLINKWQNQGGTEWSGTISLVAGQLYDIRMEYFENGWGATASLSWSSLSQAKQIIPTAALYTA